jgi:hypothetical protein
VNRNHQVGARQAASRGHESPDQRRRNGEGWVGNDTKRQTGEAQVGGVSPHDDDVAAFETLPQQLQPPVVQLDGHDPGSGFEQGHGERAVTGADVEN